ncbi:MAG: hypothetical protein U9Q83_00810 [Bacteroidota bacterium]|nr:hypothetical protein [Bacteroidota bacterium]
MKKYIYFLFFLTIIACDRNDNKVNDAQDSILNYKTEKAFEKAKEIFYSLPSPVETAMIIESTSNQYEGSFLLPTRCVDYYVQSDEQAINLGVFAADLSYVVMFDRRQETMEYLSACKKMVEELGLVGIIDDSVIINLRYNTYNKTEIMNIISAQFMDINAYFEENDREISATLMIFGGWIEGLYLAVNLIGDSVVNNTELAQMIYDQRISLEDLVSLMEMYKEDKAVSQHLTNVYQIRSIYNKMSTPISQENFLELKLTVKKMRYKFTKEKFIEN